MIEGSLVLPVVSFHIVACIPYIRKVRILVQVLCCSKPGSHVKDTIWAIVHASRVGNLLHDVNEELSV
jgi:hypothetical protein